MAGETGKAQAIRLLCEMQQRLHTLGESRYPRRGDFSETEVAQIKAHLGPWPRALEIAGLKPPRTDTRHLRTKGKRVRAKKTNAQANFAANQSTEDEQS